jgi:hypothetical protein
MKQYWIVLYLIHCKNVCKCVNAPLPGTTIKIRWEYPYKIKIGHKDIQKSKQCKGKCRDCINIYKLRYKTASEQTKVSRMSWNRFISELLEEINYVKILISERLSFCCITYSNLW